MNELPSWHTKGGGFSSAALGHRPQNRAKGADPRTGNLKGEKCFCPGVLSSPCPGLPVPGLSWFRVPGSPALPLRVPVCFGSASFFFQLAAGVAFQLPAGGTSGQAQGHRPKNRHRAPTQRPALSGTPLDGRCSETLVSCIRSIKSAGHMVVCVVTGQMVGDRWSPGATILGVGTYYLLRQPSLSCPADRSRTS